MVGTDWLKQFRGFPRLYAAASLKQRDAARPGPVRVKFSAALCRGLIEALPVTVALRSDSRFSAALCRGLIEAWVAWGVEEDPLRGFPRLYAAASLKRPLRLRLAHGRQAVFRGFMPRPH